MSARPVYNCYADLLLTKGNIVWNPSFPNNDPESYLQIAKKYIPLLHPDVVVVCFYMGNDIMTYERNTAKGRQHFFPTNAGWIKGEENGLYFENAKMAYTYYNKVARLGDESILKKCCSKSSILTLSYFLIDGLFTDPNNSNLKRSSNTTSKNPSYLRLKKIEMVCNDLAIPFKIMVLPDLVHQNPYVKNIKPIDILKNLQFLEVEGLKNTDYNSNSTDGHFNNKGHYKAACTLEKLFK
jgi:hypothetical protein